MAIRKPKPRQEDLIDVSVIVPPALRIMVEQYDGIVEEETESRQAANKARTRLEALMEEHKIEKLTCKSGRIVWLDITKKIKSKMPKGVKAPDGDTDAEIEE